MPMSKKQQTTNISSNPEKKVFDVDTQGSPVLPGLRCVNLEMGKVLRKEESHNRFIVLISEGQGKDEFQLPSLDLLMKGVKDAISQDQAARSGILLSAINHKNEVTMYVRQEEALKCLDTMQKDLSQVKEDVEDLKKEMKSLDTKMTEQMSAMKDEIMDAIRDMRQQSVEIIQREVAKSHMAIEQIAKRISKLETASQKCGRILANQEIEGESVA